MIIFYPRDIGLWREDFDFSVRSLHTLVCRELNDHKIFRDRNELIEFLKKYGVRMDDPEHPLQFIGPRLDDIWGSGVYDVVQWTLIGWIKDDYTSYK